MYNLGELQFTHSVLKFKLFMIKLQHKNWFKSV